MIDKDNKPYLRQIIMDHYTNPNNKGLIDDDNSKIEIQKSTTCADEITIQINANENKIKLIRFEGTACAVATSSCDILMDQLKDKSILEALHILENYYNLITNNSTVNEEILDELIAFNAIYKQANRINCALLAVNGIKNILKTFN
ncbi:Fe-S cluster assembly sulfur transfer protein SufU [Spiroplasma endosymbiont of Labia minor]|uniref:Fe-S cluster assembly sulfur transfer protein SufU n=1 Tax=Spiroplasma endosymbiont of Labia minor TaxID=3066305 RepID=UPI0030D31088